jgi:hypothetical protein
MSNMLSKPNKMDIKHLALAAPLAIGVSVVVSSDVRADCYAPSSVGVYCSYDNYEPPAYPSYDFDPYPFGVSPSTVQPSNEEVVSPPVSGVPRLRTHYTDGTPYIYELYPYTAEVNVSPSGQLNIRSGPGTQYPVVDAVAANTTLSITGEGVGRGLNRWMQLPNGYWINAGYLRPPSSLSPTDPDTQRIQKMLSGIH